MIEKGNYNNINSELFVGQAPSELEGETYYAYVESVEQINGNIFLRLDCIVKSFADNSQITSESILKLPSIIIEIFAKADILRSKINYNLYLLESSWLIIRTAIKQTSIEQKQFYNFIQVGNPDITNNFDLEEVFLSRDMDETSKIKIEEIKKATTLKESSIEEIKTFLGNFRFRHKNNVNVNVYDVGQGNCNAIVEDNLPFLYFDIGGGFGKNKDTFPSNFKLCTSVMPLVILSHWDQDHYQLALIDNRLLDLKWVAPIHSTIGVTAMHIAQSLLNKGNLLCWNNNLPFHDFSNHRISMCTGNPNNKNNSGLALFVSYDINNFVLLPGDASFNKISNYPTGNLIGLVASHHGARGSVKGMPVSISANPMLAYSFGRDNTYEHAHEYAKLAYNNNGWGNGLETINGNIAMTDNLKSNNAACGGGGCTLDIIQNF